MRAVIQKVSEAQVLIRATKKVCKINKGLLILIAISKDDLDIDCDYVLRKCLHSRLFSSPSSPSSDDKNNDTHNEEERDRDKQWTRSVVDLNYDCLFVSQFTLMSDLSKGNKPSFSRAMKPLEAEQVYRKFISNAKARYGNCYEGEFGAMMDVSLVNDGPMTIIIDSKNK